MKLITFDHAGSRRIGILVSDGVIDLSVVAPSLPRGMVDFLRLGADGMSLARRFLSEYSATLSLDDITIRAPVSMPGKILGIALNYADHIGEGSREAPAHQIWFNKQSGCVIGPDESIILPSVSAFVDYEVELCFIIGEVCRHVPRARAHEVIAGYCIGHDVSVRDWQVRSPTMTLGKSFDTHGPLGPWLVTSDEVGDPHDLDLKCWINDSLRQNSNTRNLIFDCYDQIAHLTEAFTLYPGDVIFTGTPSGVGATMEPPQFLKSGDSVRMEIDGLGVLENTVVDETVRTRIGK